MNPGEIPAAAKAAARASGFDACGIADLRPSRTAAHLDAWLSAGYHGGMRYLERQAPVRRDPGRAWPAARSAVVVLHNHFQVDPDLGPHRGRIARYALGDDYHDVVRQKLVALGESLQRTAGGSFRPYVDAGPLPERELAVRAGLGWYGKNTMLINPRLGSFTFIGVLLTDLEIATDEPFEADRCGTCRRCLDACPTAALRGPRVLDARRCVSYLTTEAREPIPEELRTGLGDRLFGCDTCQDVCPWNGRFAAVTIEPRYRCRPADQRPTLEELLTMTERAHQGAFEGTVLERAGAGGLARNAAAVLANRLDRPPATTTGRSGGR